MEATTRREASSEDMRFKLHRETSLSSPFSRASSRIATTASDDDMVVESCNSSSSISSSDGIEMVRSAMCENGATYGTEDNRRDVANNAIVLPLDLIEEVFKRALRGYSRRSERDGGSEDHADRKSYQRDSFYLAFSDITRLASVSKAWREIVKIDDSEYFKKLKGVWISEGITPLAKVNANVYSDFYARYKTDSASCDSVCIDRSRGVVKSRDGPDDQRTALLEEVYGDSSVIEKVKDAAEALTGLCGNDVMSLLNFRPPDGCVMVTADVDPFDSTRRRYRPASRSDPVGKLILVPKSLYELLKDFADLEDARRCLMAGVPNTATAPAATTNARTSEGGAIRRSRSTTDRFQPYDAHEMNVSNRISHVRS